MSEDFIFLSPQESDYPYSVSEINEGIALLLESGNSLVWVEGEISNWKSSSSGHIYFRLKDHQSQIPAVIWRSNVSQLKFEPRDGIAVSAIASIRVYQREVITSLMCIECRNWAVGYFLLLLSA